MSLLVPPLPLLAQAAAAPATGGSSLFQLLLPWIVIFAIWYFIVIRPQQRTRRSHEQAILALRKGDEIVTSGGLVGEVVHIKEALKDGQPVKTLDDRVTLKTGESKVVVERGRIAKVLATSRSE